MKKCILILLSAFIILLTACVADTNTSIDESSVEDPSIDVSEEEQPYIISGYTSYNPHETAVFWAEVMIRVSYYHSAAEDEAFLLKHNPDAVTIALITLDYIDFENESEYLPEWKPTAIYKEPFCLTPVTVTVDRVLLSESENPPVEGESISSTVYDRWKKQEDGSYVVEYFKNGFPACEQGKQYVAVLFENENGFGIETLSFPINPDGSYTENILEHKDSDCFRKEQWSFSDEVLKRYGIIE